ncbi:transient receptor potential cation channel protein painless-like [Temnothorax nylanderi]|uniref:transient receptor potential cation channel protein painless-like n=1 Tax=Temnothorax nylanderi TaxID=102681 RepID=UPI003A8B0F56
MEEELSEKLPFESENWERDAQAVLEDCLKNRDETKFLKCMGEIQREIPLWIAENLLTMSAQHNFQQAVTAILKKFEGKYLNVREAARTAVQNGHDEIFETLLKVKPEIAHHLILTVCLKLGEPRKGVDDDDIRSNLETCLELILKQINVDVCCTDIADISSVLSAYFDDCLKKIRNQTNEGVVEFDYRCLMPQSPQNVFAKRDTTHRPTRETEVFLDIVRNKNLKHLLKHPLLSSFLYHKWCKIQSILYTNIVFYGIFYVLLNIYILNMTYENSPNENGTQTVNNSCDVVLNSILLIRCYRLWFFVILLWLLFIIREILLFACCPCRYLMNWENWLQAVLIIFTLILLCGAGAWSRVVVIILSALMLTTLISQHPKISTNFEMFWIISRNYMFLLLPYTVLVIAFVLAFYILFENSRHFSEDSLFKTLIMVFIGEFNFNDILVDSHPVSIRIVLVLFAFFTFVSINVYGLVVNDTNEILSKAELNGLSSRIRLIVYLEDIALGEPFSWFSWFSRANSCLLQWNPFSFLTKKIFWFTHYSENDKITFLSRLHNSR